MFCFQTSKSRFTVRSNQLVTEPTTGSAAPAARRSSSWAKSGTWSRPFAFQIVSARSAGPSAAAKIAAWLHRRASRKASAGPPR